MALAPDGLVLCRVGDCGLAVWSREVDGISDVGMGALEVGRVFGGPCATGGRALLCRGQALRVDAVDVVQVEGRLDVLPVPRALQPLVRGALRGFVELRGYLWPLVDLLQLVDHLSGEERGEMGGT